MIELNTKNRVHIDAQYYAYNYNDVSDNVWRNVRYNVKNNVWKNVRDNVADNVMVNLINTTQN